jgi:hypothetical protein
MDKGRGAKAFASIGRRNQTPNSASWAFFWSDFWLSYARQKLRGERRTVAGSAISGVWRVSPRPTNSDAQRFLAKTPERER